MDKKIVDAIKSTKTVSELKDLAVKNGYNITDEQANKYFDLFYGSTALNDSELDKITGGAGDFCGAYNTLFDSMYSSDEPHYLIVSALNSCPAFKLNVDGYNLGTEKYCRNCDHCFNGDGFTLTLYCDARKKDNDPYRTNGTF